MVIEEQNSDFSGKIQVLKTFPWSKPYISTGFLTQSGGLVNDVWKPVIKLIKNYNNYLILGLAGGTLAKLISKTNPKAQITGVEIDPAMIYLGKKYLDLDTVPNLKIIIGDAQKNIVKSDVIFIDLYINDTVPDFVYSKKFLSKLKCKLLIINHLFYDDSKKTNAQVLIKLLESCANHIEIRRVLTNLIIIATPKTRQGNSTPLHQTAS